MFKVGESKRHLFVVDSLDKQMQNKKERSKGRIYLASAKGGEGAILYLCGEY